MTDPRNPSDYDNPREEASSSPDQWSWHRPADGSPVYGDGDSGQSPPPLPPEEWQPEFAPEASSPQWTPPPGVGPAQPGGHHAAQQPYGQQPPHQWPGPQNQPPHGQQGPYVNSGYVGGVPQPDPTGAYGPPYPAPPPSGMNKGLFSLFTGIFSLIVGFCCCAPIGVAGGIVGAVLGWSGMKQAKAEGRDDTPATIGFWLSLAAILLSVLSIVLNIIVTIMYPDLYTDILRDFGIG